MNITIKDTHKYGNGVFATKDIRKGSLILRFTGLVVNITEAAFLINNALWIEDSFLQVGHNQWFVLNRLANTFNHSCSPNAGMKNRADLFALRNIKKGEEIVYDYSMVTPPTEWEMVCKCGSENCRQIASDIRSIPKDVLKEYIKMGNINKITKTVIKDVMNGKAKIPKYLQEGLKLFKEKK